MHGYSRRSSGRVKLQSLEEEWFHEHSIWDPEMATPPLHQASTHHAGGLVTSDITEDDVSHDPAF